MADICCSRGMTGPRIVDVEPEMRRLTVCCVGRTNGAHATMPIKVHEVMVSLFGTGVKSSAFDCGLRWRRLLCVRRLRDC